MASFFNPDIFDKTVQSTFQISGGQSTFAAAPEPMNRPGGAGNGLLRTLTAGRYRKAKDMGEWSVTGVPGGYGYADVDVDVDEDDEAKRESERAEL